MGGFAVFFSLLCGLCVSARKFLLLRVSAPPREPNSITTVGAESPPSRLTFGPHPHSCAASRYRLSFYGHKIMKIRNSLKSLKDRHRDNRVIRRRGRTYVINKTNRRFKARQG